MTTPSDVERLKKLYDSRVPEGMSQEDFGKANGIGTQSMVSQYLSGHRPLNYDAVLKFAKGLHCTIADISPAMAVKLKTEFLPILGRVAVKTSLLITLFGFPYEPAQAGQAFDITPTKYTYRLRRLLALLMPWRRETSS